jgi:hypothetical protein
MKLLVSYGKQSPIAMRKKMKEQWQKIEDKFSSNEINFTGAIDGKQAATENPSTTELLL